jgi:nitroreductase
MRHRVRIQPYISTDLRQKLRAFAAAKHVTESAIAEAAIGEYIDGSGVEKPLFLRRFDGVMQGLGQLQDEVETMSHAVAALARYQFLTGPGTYGAGAPAQADQLYRQFIEAVCRKLGSGVRFGAEVRRAAPQPPQNSSKPNNSGGR